MRAARAAGGVDATGIRFMAAQALLKMGRPHETAETLAQPAGEHPAIGRVRLDYAASLLGEDGSDHLPDAGGDDAGPRR